MKSLDAALKSLGEAIDIAPDRPEAWHNSGVVLDAAGRSLDAAQHFRSAIARRDDHHEAWANLAFIMGRDNADAGIVVYRELLERFPGDFPAWHNLACLLRDTGEHADALIAYRAALDIRSDVPEIHHNLGLLHEAMGDVTGARRAFERAIELAPGFAPPLEALTQNTD